MCGAIHPSIHPVSGCLLVSDAQGCPAYPVVSLVHVRGVCSLRLGFGLYDVSLLVAGGYLTLGGLAMVIIIYTGQGRLGYFGSGSGKWD